MASIPNEASERANSEQLSQALGEAVVRIWGLLPPDVQQHLFEEASSHGGGARERSSRCSCMASIRAPALR